MRNKLFLAGLTLTIILASMAFFNPAEQKKQEPPKAKKASFILCTDITKTTLYGVKASKRRTATGAVVVMTSPNAAVVKKLQVIISSCRKKPPTSANSREILSMTGVTTAVTNLNNGIRIEMSSADKAVANKIKKLRLPGFPRKRSIGDL